MSSPVFREVPIQGGTTENDQNIRDLAYGRVVRTEARAGLTLPVFRVGTADDDLDQHLIIGWLTFGPPKEMDNDQP